MLLNVLPRFSLDDGVCRHNADAKVPCNLVRAHGGGHCANLANNGRGQLRCFAALHIDGIRDRLQVIRVYTGWLTAQVIHFDVEREWPKPIFSGTSMEVDGFLRHRIPSLRIPSATDRALPYPTRRGVSPVLFNPIGFRVALSVVTLQITFWLALDMTSRRPITRCNGRLFATAALAEPFRNGIVRMRHLIASLQAIGGATARSVPTLPGSLRCLNYTKNPIGMGAFRG